MWSSFPPSATIAMAVLSSAGFLSGCAEDPGPDSLDVVFTPNLALNGEADLVERLADLEIVLDHDEGLYPADGALMADTFEVRNADADATLELFVTVPIEDRLPRVRFEQGSFPSTGLELRATGRRNDASRTVIAETRVPGLSILGPETEVPIVLDLAPAFLPLRVSYFSLIGEMAEFCVVPSFYIDFSQPVDPESLAGQVVLEGQARTPLTPTRVEEHTAYFGATDLGAEGNEVTAWLEVGTGVRDREGFALDQIPATAGPQPYRVRVALMCGQRPMTPTGCPGISCLNGFQCVEGECIREVCGRCTDGFRCDVTRLSCLPDCGLYTGFDPCLAAGQRCEPSTGRCI
ncbi:MAG: hypothetical protein AAGF12_04995 [Myxococcota bacterium]